MLRAAHPCAIVRSNPKDTDMADDKSKTGGQDRTLIALGQDYEVRDWAKKFGVTVDELRAAVKAVGNKAADVEAYLKKR